MAKDFKDVGTQLMPELQNAASNYSRCWWRRLGDPLCTGADQSTAALVVREHAYDVWIIAEVFVREPYVGGQLLGQIPSFDLTGYTITRKLTQEQFDAECLAARQSR